VEVKIGVQNAPREITVETGETAEEVERLVSEAVKAEGGVLTLSDNKGRRVIVPADRISYVEIGGGVQGAVGFRH
jgi:Protein of unknown function (DUF3107)